MAFDKKSWSKNYREKNRDRINENKRIWRKKNPDKVREENARASERTQLWRDGHKDEKRLYDYRRRNRLRFGGNYDKVLERDGYSCTNCGGKSKLCVHHIDGNGRNSITPNNAVENLQTLCLYCHSSADFHNGGHGH